MDHCGFTEIIGAQIAGVVVKGNPQPPRQQIFLLFADGTHFEIYGGDAEPIKGAKGIDFGGLDRIKSIGQGGQKVTIIPETGPEPPGELSYKSRTAAVASTERLIDS